MRVLLVTHGYPPESVGGVEQHVHGLAGALRDAGHHVEVFTRSSREGEPGSLHADVVDGVPVTRAVYRWADLAALRDLYRCPVTEQALRRFVGGRSFDVAHVHHLTGIGTGAVGVLHDAGCKVVLTLHDYWIMCPRGQMWHHDRYPCERVEPVQCAACLAPTFGRWLPADRAAALVGELHDEARATLAAADRLLTPSARTIPFFTHLGVEPGRIAVVGNGVDTARLRGVPAPRRDGPLRIGYLGTLIPSKGLDVLVAAFLGLEPGSATLTIHGNAVPYHGDDGFLTRVFQQVPPGTRGLSFHGPYTGDQLPALLAGIDVLAAPALWHEAFGLTVREAQAAGRAVVVSRIGGLQDAVADGVEGLVVPPGDTAALAAALRRLHGDRALVQAMGERGRLRTRGFAAMAEELVAHYRSTANA